MKAAVVTSFGAPLEIQERDIPEPALGQVLIRMEACGLCHTDIHAAHGDWPVKPTLPLVPGHEGVGIVEKLGAEVTDRTVGERVAIAWLGSAKRSARSSRTAGTPSTGHSRNTRSPARNTSCPFPMESVRWMLPRSPAPA